MKQDWEKIGFLVGLSKKDKKIVSNWYDQIVYDDILNDIAKVVIHAVIRSIYAQIRDNTYLPKKYTTSKLLEKVDVSEIVDSFDDYCEHFIPEGKLWLKNLDAQAELCSLFCHNYRLGLFKKIDDERV